MFLKIEEVSRRYDISHRTIWRWADAGQFPKPVKFGPKTCRWSEMDLSDYEKKKHRENLRPS
jgi:predicted DNA-binding transcriptional regulator AlpA